MYEYKTPYGMEDTFFQYVYDPQYVTTPPVTGTNPMNLGVHIADGDFLFRYWSGLPTIADQLQIYDTLKRQYASAPMLLGAASNAGYGQMVVVPEVLYPYNADIRFDLYNFNPVVAGVDGALTIYKSQMVFSGARRKPTSALRPHAAVARYKEIPFSYPHIVTINNYASTGGVLNQAVSHQIMITEYDFELRRIELALQSQAQTSQFKMLLFNQDKRQVSSQPVLSNLICHLNPQIQGGGEPHSSSGELSFWPCPPMQYRVNSVIRFDIYSLLVSPTVLPQTFQLLFNGVRKIPC